LSRGYYISTAGNVNTETIRKYIEARNIPEGGEIVGKCKNNQSKKSKSKGIDILVNKFPVYLTPEQTSLARTLQREAAKVWNTTCTVHRTIYIKHYCWLDEGAMKAFVKGKYGVHSQSAQA
jgi:putative transposase